MERPWLKFYGETPARLEYPVRTLYGAVRDAALWNPGRVAWDFLGTASTYRKLIADIDRIASAFATLGIGKGDRVTVALPNTPHGLIAFYALNRLGAVASMIHPLSAPEEIRFYLTESESRFAVTLDAFYGKFRDGSEGTPLERLVLCRIPDYLSPVKGLLFSLTKGRKIPKVPKDPRVVFWSDLQRRRQSPEEAAAAATAEPDPYGLAVILYSGGTTGTPKGIMLSSMNFNVLGGQLGAQGPIMAGESMLTILPMFHGFGLGASIHSILIAGARCILVPKFTAATVATLIRKRRPQYIAGVPTLYEALASSPEVRSARLSCLKGAYCGGDSLPRPIKERFDATVRAAGGTEPLREGYGLTESVTACIVMPRQEYREGSIGIPLPDMDAKIVEPETLRTLPMGEEGEICVTGPTLMLGYLNHPEETAEVLRRHDDGRVWLHTGDLGTMDGDGFLYFRQRLKRIIKVSGVSVYPSQVEGVLNSHPAVSSSCVIGVPDPHQMYRIKAFVVLEQSDRAAPEMEEDILQWCRKHLITYSCPRDIEFRTELPVTLVGKVAYRKLEEEEFAREG